MHTASIRRFAPLIVLGLLILAALVYLWSVSGDRGGPLTASGTVEGAEVLHRAREQRSSDSRCWCRKGRWCMLAIRYSGWTMSCCVGSVTWSPPPARRRWSRPA